MSEYRFQVQGMSCGHCVAAIEEALAQLDPKAQVRVDLAGGQVDVQSEQPREALAAAIADAGYALQQP